MISIIILNSTGCHQGRGPITEYSTENSSFYFPNNLLCDAFPPFLTEE